MISLIQDFESDFLWKVSPQNPEFRNNPKKIHPMCFVSVAEQASLKHSPMARFLAMSPK